MARKLEHALALFDEVAALDVPQRARRLEEIGGADPELRAALESLLGSDQSPTGALERGPVVPPEILAALAKPAESASGTTGGRGPLREDIDLAGRRIGSFTLLRRIGRGGMGVVWEAEQEKPRRRVALKVMRTGLTSSEAVQRFHHEVECLGRLQHASIAQVYDAGTFGLEGEERPWFAMELVPEGRTLDEHVRASAADLRARVRLFTRICEAVQHGHQRGIIHRDLKPSNVLLGPDGIPKVIDFGVARATDLDVTLATQRTGLGELVGTLAYMSPEQCDADPGGLDVRSDVYSLGVMLYELLCGRPPYSLKGLTLLAAAMVIRTHEPEPPGRFAPRLRGDLDAVILKALDKDRRRRYSSAEALGADLRRWLDGDPVEARLPSRWHKAARWIARHPLKVTLAACVLLVTVSALSMFVVAYHFGVEPGLVAIDPTGQQARLLSRAGRELKSWTLEGGNFSLAKLLERPEEAGGGTFLALAFKGGSTDGLDGQVYFFDPLAPETPYWTSAQHPLVAPEEGRSQLTGRYLVEDCEEADVFESVPGPELVALHRNSPFEATAIRIYDCLGGLRYQSWHFGGLSQVHWMSEARLLVVGGVNSELRWDELGHPMDDSKALYPAVVLALEPRDGHVETSSYLAFGGGIRDPLVRWYKWLGPPEEVGALQAVVAFPRDPEGNWNGSQYSGVCFESAQMEPRPCLSLIVDSRGEEVGRVIYDSYKRWQLAGSLPPASVYRLIDYAELFHGR